MGEAIDCVFSVSDNKCSVLTSKKCSGCSFKMSEREQEERKVISEQRLSRRLTPQQRRDIKARYEEKKSK